MPTYEKNTKPCPCCNQTRPYPTDTGIWEYCEYPVMPASFWVRVTVKRTEDGLTITPEGQNEPIWWPSMASWRKIE